jgi:ribonucleoside-diphosphate reductase alpha chain
MQLNIIKRNGSTLPFNIDKIKQVIAWACNGYNVNPLLLESKVTAIFTEGISTRAIQDNLIQSAVTLTSIDEPHWKDVAGRLMMMNVWKEVKLSRGYRYENSYQAIKSKIELGVYSSQLKVYSDADIQEAVSWIEPALDLNYDQAGMSVLANPNPNKRYLIKDELLQEAYITQSLMLASIESKEDRLKWAKQFYYWLANKKISLATPFWTNLRKPEGNISSCFIISVEDDIDSIFRGIHKVANISKSGGGVGINLSKVRSNTSWVRGKAKASNGVVPFIKVINDTAVAVDQGGSRAGAVTPSIDSWGLDILEFLEMQTEQGDNRRKCFDIFPQVVSSDEFIRRVKANQEWTLVDPYEVRVKYNVELAETWGTTFEKVYAQLEAELEGNGSAPSIESKGLTLWKKVNARDLYKQLMKSTIETGLPNESFKDTINRYNPNKHDGYIPAANLCMESYSNVKADNYDHVCNLLSFNLANLTLEELPTACEVAVRMLDNGIELTVPPTQHSSLHNKRYRTIGIGYMGLHDHLVLNNLNYSTGKEYCSKLAENIAYYSFKTSIKLGKERGSFNAFEGSELSKGIILGKVFYKENYILVDQVRKYYTESELQEATKYLDSLEVLFNDERLTKYKADKDWTKLTLDIQKGIRNSQLTAVAPNTTTSLIQGCTSSILPVFSKFFMDKSSKGTTVSCPPYLTEKFWHYIENKNTDQSLVITIAAELQKWICSGISLELVLDLNKEEVNAKYYFDKRMEAWEKGIKTLYYVRSIDKQKNPDKECSSCAG